MQCAKKKKYSYINLYLLIKEFNILNIPTSKWFP